MSQRFCTESLIIVSNVTEPTDDLDSETEVAGTVGVASYLLDS